VHSLIRTATEAEAGLDFPGRNRPLFPGAPGGGGSLRGVHHRLSRGAGKTTGANQLLQAQMMVTQRVAF
jgi:hypothetical protein